MSTIAEMIIEEAKQDAEVARDKAVAKYGDTYPCGFAWIAINPARGEFVKYCKKNRIGRKGYPKGWHISVHDFAKWNGQNMMVKEEIASAAAKVLQSHGINAYAASRID